MRDDDRILSARDPWFVGAATMVLTFIVTVAAFFVLVLWGLQCGAENAPAAVCEDGDLLALALLGAPLAVVLGGVIAGRRARWRPLGAGLAIAVVLIVATATWSTA